MQSVKPLWLNVAPFQLVVLWQFEHCPAKWLAGAFPEWHDRQSVKPVWSKTAPFQVVVE